MPKVGRLFNVTLVSALSLAALMFLLVLGSREASAVNFTPSSSASVAIAGAGAVSNVTTSSALADDFPSSLVTFTPGDWSIAGGGGITIGDRTHTSTSVTSLGILNGACALAIPIPGLPLINASINTADVLTAVPGFSNLINDSTGPGGVGGPNGIPDGADRYNNLLLALIPAPPVQRSWAQIPNFLSTGTNIAVDLATYSPGLIAPAGLGYATVLSVENFSPVLPPVGLPTGIITDTCTFSTALTTFGTTTPGPGFLAVPGFAPAYPAITPGGATGRTNPATPGSKLFFTVVAGDRDADADGVPNSDDTCAFTPNVGNPYGPAAPLHGLPVVSGDAGEVPTDGIDAACDNGTVFTDGNPGAWSATSACRVGGGDDGLAVTCDADSFANRADNCPQHKNDGSGGSPPQAPESEAFLAPMVDGGPQTDTIGAPCDLNPGVADGHYHKRLLVKSVCITGGPFSDLEVPPDGWCDATEVALGNTDLTGTPENLAVPTTCENGLDDDLDGAADLADSGCQLPSHDLAIKKTTGAGETCKPSNTNGYNVILNNNGPADPETGEIGILVDPIPGTGGSGPSVTSVSGATVTGSGPINIDGDTDVEWLTKAVVSPINAGPSTVVHFNVTYPACGAGPDVSPVDYLVIVDLCHQNDVAPLGLFGAAACGASAGGDGGMDTTAANDAPVLKTINDVTK